MNPPTPPRLVKKTKDRTVMAIVLTVLLHVVFAIIVYFTVFAKEAALQPLPSTIDPSTTTTLQTQPSLIAQEELELPIVTSATNQSSNTAQSNTIDVTQPPIEQQTANSTSSKRAKISITDENIADDSVINLSAQERVLTKTNPSLVNNQNKETDYQLQKTKEYESLEEQIEKDNEQLSNLIAEVKKYNQSQIQQQQMSTLKNTTDRQNSPSSANSFDTSSDNNSSLAPHKKDDLSNKSTADE